MKTDGLTVLSSQPIIQPEKLHNKSLDQMTMPERAKLLSEAYSHIEGADDVSDEEMELMARFSTAVDEKIVSWGIIIKKIDEAEEICKVEEDYYKAKAAEAKERGAKFKKKSDNMRDFLQRKMIECNKKKVETPLVSASLKKKRQSVVIDNSADLEKPEDKEFVITTVSRVWDKKKIKEKIDAGGTFKTVRMSDPDSTLTIK